MLLATREVGQREGELLIRHDAEVGLTSQLVVQRGELGSLPEPVAIARATPRIFTTDGSGQGEGVIVDAGSGQLAGSSNPLKAGQRIWIYASGLGAVDQVVPPGATVPAEAQPNVASPVEVLFDGVASQVESAVLAPSALNGAQQWLEPLAPAYVGIYRITTVVPEGLNVGSVRLILKTGGASSLPVTVQIQ